MRKILMLGAVWLLPGGTFILIGYGIKAYLDRRNHVQN